MENGSGCGGLGNGSTGRLHRRPLGVFKRNVLSSLPSSSRDSIVWSPLCYESAYLFGLSIPTLWPFFLAPSSVLLRFGVGRGAFPHASNHYPHWDGVPIAVHRLETCHHGRISHGPADSEKRA